MEFAGRDARVTRGRKQAPRLLEQVRDRLRVKHYSLRTEGSSLPTANGIRARWAVAKWRLF